MAVNVSAGMRQVQSSQCRGNFSFEDDSQKYYSTAVYIQGMLASPWVGTC